MDHMTTSLHTVVVTVHGTPCKLQCDLCYVQWENNQLPLMEMWWCRPKRTLKSTLNIRLSLQWIEGMRSPQIGSLWQRVSLLRWEASCCAISALLRIDRMEGRGMTISRILRNAANSKVSRGYLWGISPSMRRARGILCIRLRRIPFDY